MKKYAAVVAVVAFLVLLIFRNTGVLAQNTYEYKVAYVTVVGDWTDLTSRAEQGKDDHTRLLNSMAQQGWEFVGMSDLEKRDATRYIFRRGKR